MKQQNNPYDQEEEDEEFSYDKFKKTASFPIPLIAKNAKYTQILPLSELKFL